jgi:hypothetical protein
MEWCLNCHRDPAKNLRPVSQMYNMAWEGPSTEKPVWCSVNGEKTGQADGAERGLPDKDRAGPNVASLDLPQLKLPGMRGVSARRGGDAGR